MSSPILLLLLVIVWAASWPILKIGVAGVPPVWFACVRYAIATVVLTGIVAARGELRRPSREDWRLVLVSGLLQMGAFAAFTTIALTILPPGRASILAYSTPLWVHPLAVWRKQERTSWRATCGLAIGMVGIVIIAAPTLVRGRPHALGAIAMLMAAAAAWAVTIVFVRGHRFTANPLSLAPWQTAVATTVLLSIAAITEPPPQRISGHALLALLYLGPIATAFAYWAVVEVGRTFPATTLSVALLATPSLGLTMSAIALKETVGASLLAGVGLVAVGILLTTSAPGQPRSTGHVRLSLSHETPHCTRDG